MRYLVGIDEVGRGPLAGPVSVGAFAVKERDCEALIPLNLKNSKALTPDAREEWFAHFSSLAEQGKILYNVSSISHAVVDSAGITFAIKLALTRALQGLYLSPEETHIYLDGGLRAPKQFASQETIIKGDEKIPVIAAASIMAKVTRDRALVKLAQRFPEYGFDEHKGYATSKHYERLIQYGPCEIHRLTYLVKMRDQSAWQETVIED